MQIVTAHQGLLRTTRVDGLRGKPADRPDVDASWPSSEVGRQWRVVSVEDETASTATESATGATTAASFLTGLPLLDAVSPGGVFALGVVHELLYPPRMPPPRTFALLLAVAAAKARAGPVVWSDPAGTLYPPAVARAGLPLDRLLILRPRSPADELWAATQCMRCQGVAATIVEPGRLNRVQARRLQLAAETGGGAGLLLRPQRSATDYAAATRWLVQPEPSRMTTDVPNAHRSAMGPTAGPWASGHPVDRSSSFVAAPRRATATVQRWRVELIHGHGGRLRQAIILEVSREVLRPSNPDHIPREIAAPHPVRAVDPMADRPHQASEAARAS